MKILVEDGFQWPQWLHYGENLTNGFLMDIIRSVCFPDKCSILNEEIKNMSNYRDMLIQEQVDIILRYGASLYDAYPNMNFLNYIMTDLVYLYGGKMQATTSLSKQLIQFLDFKVWIGLLLCAVILAFCYGRFWKMVWELLGFLFSEPFTFQDKSSWRRILLASWMFVTMVIVAAFSGGIKADFLLKPPERILYSIDTFHTIEENLFRFIGKDHDNQDIEIFASFCIKQDDLKATNVLAGNTVFIGSAECLLNVTANHCTTNQPDGNKFYTGGQMLVEQRLSLVMLWDKSNLRRGIFKKFHNALLGLSENGFQLKHLRELPYKSDRCFFHNDDKDYSVNPIALEGLRIAFEIWIIGIGLSSVACALEIIVKITMNLKEKSPF